MALPSSTRVTASGVVVDNGPRRETRAKVRMVGGWRAAAVTKLSLAHLLRFCGGGSRPPQICFRRRCRERQIASCGEPAWPSKLLIYLAPRDRRNAALPLLPGTPQSPKTRKRDRDHAEALRRAAGPRLPLRARAVALARERGVVRTRDLTAIGIPRCYLTRMCEESLLEKVSYGCYRTTKRKVA
jgi:hypothetical protein